MGEWQQVFVLTLQAIKEKNLAPLWKAHLWEENFFISVEFATFELQKLSFNSILNKKSKVTLYFYFL